MLTGATSQSDVPTFLGFPILIHPQLYREYSSPSRKECNQTVNTPLNAQTFHIWVKDLQSYTKFFKNQEECK